jgi:mRNA interferase YafQ
MAASDDETVKFVAAPGFKEAYRSYAKSNPEIKEEIRIFNEYKRIKPPKRLPDRMKDHMLKGEKWRGYRECHLSGNILLVYTHENDIIKLFKIYSHDEIKGKRAQKNIRTIRKLN